MKEPAISGSKLKPWQNAVSGAIAGVISRFVIAPIDVLKIRLQLQPNGVGTKYRNMAQACRLIIKEEGVVGLWKGNTSAEYLYLTYGAIQFYAFHELMQNASLYLHYVPKDSHTFLAGALTGIVATTVTYPLDLLRTRFAVQGDDQQRIYRSIVGAIRDILAREGPYGFFRGLTPSLLQVAPQMGLIFESHRLFKASLENMKEFAPALSKQTQPSHDLLCGGLAGIVSKAAVMPFDVIRKRFQVQGPVRNEIIVSGVPRYSKGVFHTMLQIIRQEGVSALYKGLGPSVVKAAPSSAVTFFVFNQCQQQFKAMN